MRRIVIALLALGVIAAGCGEDKRQDNPAKKLRANIAHTAAARQPYEPKNEVEFNNFNKAQALYDDPTTIIWCTTTWANPSAPIITIPIAGKLTSSSVSYLSPDQQLDFGSEGHLLAQAPSSDGMYHGSPPPYRYGFTPGGQYNDFFNMETYCTTSLTRFQRENTFVSTSLDPEAKTLDAQAQDALKQKDPKRAAEILSKLESDHATEGVASP